MLFFSFCLFDNGDEWDSEHSLVAEKQSRTTFSDKPLTQDLTSMSRIGVSATKITGDFVVFDTLGRKILEMLQVFGKSGAFSTRILLGHDVLLIWIKEEWIRVIPVCENSRWLDDSRAYVIAKVRLTIKIFPVYVVCIQVIVKERSRDELSVLDPPKRSWHPIWHTNLHEHVWLILHSPATGQVYRFFVKKLFHDGIDSTVRCLVRLSFWLLDSWLSIVVSGKRSVASLLGEARSQDLDSTRKKEVSKEQTQRFLDGRESETNCEASLLPYQATSATVLAWFKTNKPVP